ncbi:MAG: SAM-dependent methyltransferase [Tannerella sp.]|jgi:16S rRNA (cytidine1402-2'-O)-methyltransferase|nr:SAM-dependent methyltransferase [Tannerella sp.]
MNPILYLIPVTLGETAHDRVLPPYNREVILSLKHFIVEDLRTARRFLKKVDPSVAIDKISFTELNEHTSPAVIPSMLTPMEAGESIGVMSEAGCPAVADPGADIVAVAQRKGYCVTPLVGPSSILMALMASGFNGQRFAFHGYLPVDISKRAESIKAFEARMYSENETQIFIETPYRNYNLLNDFVRICRFSTRLCVACNITCDDEFIRTLPVKEWAGNIPDMKKRPTVFLMYK